MQGVLTPEPPPPPPPGSLLLLLPTPVAPFDRWRKGGSQGSKGLLQGHPAREWGRRLHSGLLTPSPVLFRGNTQDLESGALGGSGTHWLRGPAQACSLLTASIPNCKMRRLALARPGPLLPSFPKPSRDGLAKLSLSITFPKLGRPGSPEDPRPVTWPHKKSQRPRLTFTALRPADTRLPRFLVFLG